MMRANSVLYFAPASCARVSLTALEEIGQPFETRLVAFMAGEHRSKDYLAINPSGKVPALQTADGVLVQTGAILYYLAQKYPQAELLPLTGKTLRRCSRSFCPVSTPASLHPLVTRFVIPGMILSDPASSSQVRMKAEEILKTAIGSNSGSIGETGFGFLPSGWSVLDPYLAWIWFRITNAGFDETVFPEIAHHYHRAGERPSAKAALRREAEAQAELEARGLIFTPPNLLKIRHRVL